MRALVAVCVLGLVGCKSAPENGFAVDVTVTADSSVPDAVLAQVKTLDVSVSGAEVFHTTYPITTQLTARKAKFIYRPGAMAGTLSFAVYALDSDGNALAFGMGSAALKNGATVTLTISLGTGNVPSTDMAMCPTPCTLGATQCAGTQVQTCQLVDGCLTWGPAADCGTNMLCCADACVAADVSNCYACGTACSGSTPACLPTPQKCGCSVGVCAAGNMGCDTASGDCVACTALPANSADFYVDTTSFAGGTGNAVCPFKTITAALTAANASTAANKTSTSPPACTPPERPSRSSCARASRSSAPVRRRRRSRATASAIIRSREASSTAPPIRSRSLRATRRARRPSPD